MHLSAGKRGQLHPANGGKQPAGKPRQRALLLGAGDAVLSAAGAAVPELVGCRFPLSALHELRSATQRDFARLFLPGEVTVLYGPVPWVRRLRTLLEMMRAAMPEQDYPGGLYLLLILHYVEQECLAERQRRSAPPQRDH